MLIPRPGWRTRRTAWWMLALCLLPVQQAAAQAASAEMLKAEVIYRALMFVTWPAGREAAGRSLPVCTLGEGRVETALQALQGRPIRHLSVEVRRLAKLDQAVHCQLLYVSTPTPMPALKAALADAPVLVVSDASAMLDHGAMINLQIEDGRIVFDVELDATRRAGLDISTKLLRLARFVRHQQPAS
ncbi:MULTISPECIES: YfiR family protein [unclassified Roseateles]|uniref:YfiR family protein n=1 Tax=unclassified Roseateles TaxID=2626991 RepID=UPI0006FB8849|nr:MULTISPECIES: YfiR family protein [unclassified Roseateles]